MLTDYTYTVQWDQGTAAKTVHSPACLEVTGYSPKEFASNSCLCIEVVYEDDREQVRERAERIRSGEDVEAIEYRIVRKDGAIRWVRETAVQYFDGRDVPVSYEALIQDITNSKQVDELRKLSAAVEQSPAMVIITDIESTIEYVNPRFTETTGYTAKEIIGQHSRSLVSGDMSPEAYKQMWATLFAGEVWREECHNKRKDGTSYREAVSISPIRNSESVITHFLTIKEDITERKQAEEELQRARATAEAADRAKSEFLANMSHEIRTPLNAIIGYADLLWREGNIAAAPPQRAEAIAAIRNSGRCLLDLINNILDLSRIESGKVQMEIADYDPWCIVTDVVSALNVRAAKQQIELVAEITGAIPKTIRTDSGRLGQCLMNLVGNAVKFTGEGGVNISVGMSGSSDEPTIRFEICDTGIGIPQNRMDAIFQAFTQADNSTTRKFGGTGLGLAISRQVARALGGDITARSVDGQGSTFTLEVPAGSLDGVSMRDQLTLPATAPSEPVPQAAAPELSGRILVAEDSMINRDMLVAMLSDLDIEIAAVENGLAAVEAVETESFDVILMDWQMPVMDGLEATRRIRATGNEVPIIALTANAMRGDREKCLAAGCTGYLSKPVDYGDLLGELQKYLKHVAVMNAGQV
jgi:hypothetical protein